MKQRIRAIVLAIALLVSLSAYAPHALAAGTVTVSHVSGRTGELVDVAITLTSDDVCSGNFNVCYDHTALELVEVTANSSFNCLTNLLQDGKLRVSFMRLTTLTDETLCTLIFRVTEQTSTEGTDVTIEQIKLYNEESTKVSSSVIAGSVVRNVVCLNMREAETSEHQEVSVVIDLDGELKPAGGNFTLSYDPSCFTVQSVLPLKAMGDATYQYNVIQPGTVRVSFGGTEELKSGPLCTVIFQAIGSSGNTSELVISDAKMYDVNSVELDVTVTNGSLSIISPSAESPKLWVAGGAVTDDGSADVAVIMQGRGQVCGGNFTLSYNPTMTPVVQAHADCQIRQGDGTIRVSWASSTAYTGEEALINISFIDAVDSQVSIDDVILYDEDSEAISIIDVRDGQISVDTKVVAVIDDVDNQTNGEISTYNVSVDITDINYNTEQALETITLVLALYENGRLVGVEMQTSAASGSGVNEISLTAETQQNVSDLSVFVLNENLLPLIDLLNMTTTE